MTKNRIGGIMVGMLALRVVDLIMGQARLESGRSDHGSGTMDCRFSQLAL
jgi:hypothetical protein